MQFPTYFSLILRLLRAKINISSSRNYQNRLFEIKFIAGLQTIIGRKSIPLIEIVETYAVQLRDAVHRFALLDGMISLAKWLGDVVFLLLEIHAVAFIERFVLIDFVVLAEFFLLDADRFCHRGVGVASIGADIDDIIAEI